MSLLVDFSTCDGAATAEEAGACIEVLPREVYIRCTRHVHLVFHYGALGHFCSGDREVGFFLITDK